MTYQLDRAVGPLPVRQLRQLNRLQQRLMAMADYIEKNGHCWGQAESPDGRVCVIGAWYRTRQYEFEVFSDSGVDQLFGTDRVIELTGGIIAYNDSHSGEEVVSLLRQLASSPVQ